MADYLDRVIDRQLAQQFARDGQAASISSSQALTKATASSSVIPNPAEAATASKLSRQRGSAATRAGQ